MKNHKFSVVEVTTSENYTFKCRVGGIYVKDKVIFFLHGFPETSRMWERSIDFFVSKGFYVIAPDQRGYSFGARPSFIKDYSIDKLANDIIEISEKLNINNFHLIGHDWGAAVGWYVTAKQPKKIKSFTSLSVPHLNAFSNSLKYNSDQKYKSYYMILFQIRYLPEFVLKLFNFKILRAIWGKHEISEVQSYINTFKEKNALKSAINWYRASYFIKISKLEDILVPTLLIYGKRDKYLGRYAIDQTRKYIKGPYKLKTLNASHWLIQECFHEVVEEILEHIKS